MRNQKGQFAKGNGGKPKGATSKKNEELKDRLKALLDNNIDQLNQDLQDLEPKDRVKAVMDLIKYFVPTLKSQNVSIDERVEQPLFPREIRRVIVDVDGKESVFNKETGTYEKQ